MALRNFASIQALIEVRSTGSRFGNSWVTPVMNGPAKESFAALGMSVGMPNSVTALARIWKLTLEHRRLIVDESDHAILRRQHFEL
jgi:hypothetical protein